MPGRGAPTAIEGAGRCGDAPRWGWRHGASGRPRLEATREARVAGARGQHAEILPAAIREAGQRSAQ
jgi:hypothetical protein